MKSFLSETLIPKQEICYQSKHMHTVCLIQVVHIDLLHHNLPCEHLELKLRSQLAVLLACTAITYYATILRSYSSDVRPTCANTIGILDSNLEGL